MYMLNHFILAHQIRSVNAKRIVLVAFVVFYDLEEKFHDFLHKSHVMRLSYEIAPLNAGAGASRTFAIQKNAKRVLTNPTIVLY